MNDDKAPTKKASRARQPALFEWRLLSIGLTTALALILTVGLPFSIIPLGLMNRWVAFLLFLLIFGLVPLVVGYNIFRSIAIPFERTLAWQKRVCLVIVGYLAMILTYSGVYFSIAAIGDYNQAVSSNVQLQYLQAQSGSDWAKKSREDLLHELKDVRPFKGMSHSVFLAVHQDPAGLPGERRYLTVPQILERVQNEKEREPRRDSAATLGLLVDCIHFSIARAASVGSVDITAVSTFAKLVADTQILVTLGILVFGLGLVMSDRPGKKSEEDHPDDERTIVGKRRR